MKRLKKIVESWGRLLFVLLILIFTFSFAMFQGGFVSWFIFYMTLPFILYSLFLTIYPLTDIHVERHVHTNQIRSGNTFRAAVTMRRKFPFPLLYTVVQEQTNSPVLKKHLADAQHKMLLPGFRKSHTWEYEIEEMPRGEHVLEGIQVEIADFFGWVKKTRLVSLPQTILVYPNTVEIPYRPMESRYDQGAMAAPFTLVKDTTMASGLRDYRPGDRVSWIHWKSFARTQTMRTKEFEDRQSQDLFVMDDRKPSDKFEVQVELVASILQSVVRANSSVGYLSIGDSLDYFPHIQTEENYQRIMYHLAKVQPDLKRPLSEISNRNLQEIQSSTLLYVTSRLTLEMIEAIQRNSQRLSNCICLVVMNKGDKLSKEDEATHQFIRSKGFIVKTVRPENFAGVFTEVSRK